MELVSGFGGIGALLIWSGSVTRHPKEGGHKSDEVVARRPALS